MYDTDLLCKETGRYGFEDTSKSNNNTIIIAIVALMYNNNNNNCNKQLL